MGGWETKGGHMSGSTPVSELAVPDVLFKPGAGAIAPQPRDAVPSEPAELAAIGGLEDVINLVRRRWAETGAGDGRPFLVELLESSAAIAVRNLRATIPEDAKPGAPDPAAVARFVAQSWYDAARADSTPETIQTAIALEKVLSAFDGETDPRALGITPDEAWPFGGYPDGED